MSTNSTLPIGALITERLAPTVQTWLDREYGLLQKLRVATPGVIQSFNGETQTAVVQVCLLEQFRIAALSFSTGQNSTAPVGQFATSQITTQKVPQLQDVPVVFPRAGGFALTFPVKAGDECLLVFGDSCIDDWWQGSANAGNNYTCKPLELRRHDLSDAFAIVGIWNQQRVLTDYSTDAVQLRTDEGTVYVEVGATEVTIASSGNVTVNASSGTVTVNAMTANVNATNCSVSVENLTVDASNSINMTANGAFNITGSTVHIVSTAMNSTLDGRTFLLHLHTGGTIAGDTGPVI
jgi:hypothetical protein